jgi:hypothetical protein
MMINRTAEFINYRQTFPAAQERTPRFLRRAPAGVNGADRVDISTEARELFLGRNSSPLVKAGLKISWEIGELMLIAEQVENTDRRQTLEAIGSQIKNGSYDFDSAGKIDAAGKAMLEKMGRA